MLHLRKVIILVILIAIGILASELSAQDKDSWKEKVKDIKGEGVKVRVETTEGAYFFDGDEAIELVKHIKSTPKQMKFITKHSGKDFDLIGGLDSIMTKFVVLDDYSKGLKKIEITSETGGEKIVTITTDDDGKETVEILEGEDADEYIKTHMKKDCHTITKSKVIMLGDDSNDEEHTIWITDDFEDEGSFEKEIKIKMDSLDSGNKIIIKTIKDGKEEVKVFEGDEAKKYIKEHGSHKISKHLLMDCDEDDNVYILKSKNLKGKSNMNWNIVEEEVDEDGNNVTKKIMTEIVDGNKKVTITTITDGDEKVEVLEGKEADEYLKKMKKGKSLMFISEDGDVSTFDGKTIKVRDCGDDKEIEVEVEVESDDDAQVEKKVIIKQKK